MNITHSPRTQNALVIRPAVVEDAPFIAVNVLAAIDLHKFEDPLPESLRPTLKSLSEICAKDDTLYSWKNTIIAEVGGVPAGSLTSYDGARYRDMRKLTFGFLLKENGMNLENEEMETKSGEYYLDSLAILPEFRGQGIGRQLILNAMDIARKLGITTVSLIVSEEKPRLKDYYNSIGFVQSGKINFYGHDSVRMVMSFSNGIY